MSQPLPHWLETTWSLPKEDVDEFQTELTQHGSIGSYEKMGLDDREEALRQNSEFIVYFADGNPADLRARLTPCQTASRQLVAMQRIPQAEWATEWKKYFKPFFLTPEVVIRPSWEEYAPQGTEKVVTLDPGMAFGTGQHDTTRFCAELICDLSRLIKAPSLIDVGCGSGILSIIAKKMGFAKVTGFDLDPAAVETSLENLARNPDVGDIHFFKTSGELKNLSIDPAHVVVSNIIAETLCELKQDLLNLVKKEGFLILSGIMSQREDMVKSAFADLHLVQEKKSNDWHAYLYRV